MNKIVISGFSGAHEKEQVVAAFAQLFHIPAEKAAQMLSHFPLPVKEGVDDETAQKYRANLERIGLRVEVIAASAELALEPLDVSTEAAPVATLAAQQVAATEGSQPGFQFRVEGRPDYAFLTVQLNANETIKVEASAMATMDTSLKMKTKLKGGLGRFLTGESIFVNEFTAEHVPGEIGIAPGAPGDLAHVYLNNETLYLQNSAFVACNMAVNLETKWQGFTKGFFSGENFFLIRASGKGDLWFNTYGGMIVLDIDDDYVVDTGNIVAFTDGLEYSISKVGGYKSLFFSGEGLVCRFKGRGKVWVQTRTSSAFVNWAHAYRPVQRSN